VFDSPTVIACFDDVAVMRDTIRSAVVIFLLPDLIRLLDAANLLCEKRPATVLRVAVGGNDKKSPQNPHKSAPQKDSGRPGNAVKS
jgi:hypothetical protein